ncbi:MAG: hypothetical protein AB1Z98_20035, partial [Nannocystaceae bacterium]
GTMPYFGRLMNANERPRLLQAMAWVDTAELAVDGPAARGIGAGVDVARSPVDGRLYPNKPPGATLPAVVAYAGLRSVAALGGPTPTLRGLTMLARVLGGLVPTLLLLLLLARRLRARGAGPTGDGAVLLLALATPLSSYAHLLFGHSLAACLLLAGMLWLLDGTDPAEASPTRSWRRALGGGVLAASAITVEYLAVFAGIPLAVLLGLRWRQGTPRPVLVAAVAGALLSVAALAGYHAVVFGSPWATGYHHVVDAGFAQTHGRGLLGLGIPSASSLFEHLLSPWGGLLVWAPLVALALVFSLVRWHALDLEERLASSTLLLLLLVTLGLAQTGGWRVGPRYLVLAMPLAGYGLVGLLRAAAGRAVVGALVLGVALESAVLNALAASLFPHLIPHGNPWADLLLPLAAEGRMGYALLPGVVARFTMLALPLGLLGWALWRVLASSSGPRSRTRAAVFAAGSLLGVGLLVAGLTPPEHPEADADLRAVRSIWEPEGPRPAPRTELLPLPE